MAKEFQGKIQLDIRDSEPGWAPYLAPKRGRAHPSSCFLLG